MDESNFGGGVYVGDVNGVMDEVGVDGSDVARDGDIDDVNKVLMHSVIVGVIAIVVMHERVQDALVDQTQGCETFRWSCQQV